MPELRGLTLWRPMAWAIFHGKDVENRSWPPPRERLGALLAIHAGQTYDADAEREILAIHRADRLPPEAQAEGILGVVTLDRFIQGGLPSGSPGPRLLVDARGPRPGAADPAFGSPWYLGRYGWCLRDAVEFREPIACRGARGLWRLPPPLLEQVLARLDAARG